MSGVGRFSRIARSAALAAAVGARIVAAQVPQAPSTGAIVGRVTDAATGRPVGGAKVRAVAGLAAGSGRVADSAFADDDGRYRMPRLAPGAYVVVVNAIGHAPQRAGDVDVVAGGSTDVSFRLLTPQLERVVVTGSRERKVALDEVSPVLTVGREEVEARPTLTHAEHLQQLPGVDVAMSGLMSGTVVTHGFNNAFSGALLTLIDNRYAFVPSLRSNTAFLIPALDEDVDHIELAVGPGAALYGPNSANGVMNVITRSPFDSKGTTVTLGAGERDVRRGALRTAAGTDRVAVKLEGQYMEGTDWKYVDPAEPPGARGDYATRRYSGEARLAWKVTDRATADVAFGRSHAGRAIEITGVGAVQAKDWQYDYYQARFRSGRLFAQAFVNTSDAGDTHFLRTPQPIRDNSRMYVAQLQYGSSVGAREELTYGVDAQRTDPRTFGTLNGRNEDVDAISEVGGYVHSDTRLADPLHLIAAVRVDKHSVLDRAVVSPRLALLWKPSATQSLHVAYNRAFDTPSTNNLFFDFLAGQAGPYGVRTRGVPAGGFHFRRDCDGDLGLCMKSPFAPDPSAFLPADATAMWPAIVQILKARGIDLSQLPPPTAADVGSVLRALDPTAKTFADVSPGDVRDIAPLRPTITTAVEMGYKGVLWNRLSVSVTAYRQHVRDFVGPLLVETPNVFFETASLTSYLGRYMSPAQAAQLAAVIGGVAGSTAAPGIPVGTVVPNDRLSDSPDIILTYRNYGKVDLWGGDLGVEAIVSPLVTLTGTYSYVSKDFFGRTEIGGLGDLALNAPANKGSLGARLHDERRGLSAEVRTRFVSSFPVISGPYVGRVGSYQIADAALGYRLPFARGTRLTVSAQNLFDQRHREFIGAPKLGRLVYAQLQQTF